MAGRGYTIFDSTIGRCGIAWGASGIVAVQLPEAREIETRRRMLRQYPDARELRPSLNAEIAIDGIAALLRSQPSDFSDVTLDMRGMPPFNRRVCEVARTIPRGETVTLAEFARQLGASGATHAVGQAIGRNPFAILVPCHRVLATDGEADRFSINSGTVSQRRLLFARRRTGQERADAVRRAASRCAAASA